MNNKRKNRGPVRTQRTRSVIAEGVYNNAHFMHSATLQIGNVVRIKTASGVVWEGVFKTFSSSFDVVLEVAAKVDNPNTPAQTLIAESLVDKLIFKSTDISTMEARDVDLEYPTKDTFQTDATISARLNGNPNKSGEEKELEPWDGSSGVNGGGESVPLELENANGWDANDMFRKNEQEYGVTSTFDQSLKGYTVPLKGTDTADYREAEAKAQQIANEIENQPQYKARLELENGDEEAAFAAVARPNHPQQPQQEPNDKYIPPAKRKNQNSGKLVRSTPPPQSQGVGGGGGGSGVVGGAVQTTPSPKGASAPPPMTYPTHPSPAAASTGPPPSVPNNVHQMAAQHMPPPPQMVMQPMPPNHGRPHSHTPPHGYGNQMQRPPPQMKGSAQQQMNGEAKPPMGGGGGGGGQRPRGAYAGGGGNVPPQTYQQEQAKMPQVQQDSMGGHRHVRDDAIKDLHGFAQDFKLGAGAAPVNEQPPPQVPMEQQPPPPQMAQQKQQPPQQTTPPQQQPQQSISPQQDPVEKVATTFKKSTLNPNAKEFVLNPAAKPFQPRSPSTPSVSRPHTPQTPSHSPYIPATVSGPVGQPHMPVVMPLGYMMASQPQYQPQPQGNRMRKIPMSQMRTDVASQMQVAAATGQPLLAPPIQQFVYPPGINPQGYPQMHTLRMYETPPQIQYLPPNPSNTPSPAQQPQYTPGQGPQPPPQQYQAAPPPQSHHQIPPIMCSIFQPHMMQNMQYLQQPPPPQHHIPVMLPHQHPQAQHGPAP